MRRTLIIILSLVLLLLMLPCRRVSDHDMRWSLHKGDLVWIVDTQIRRGDIVSLYNPLDKNEKILRRAIAGPGQSLDYDKNGSLRIDGKRVRQKDMGRKEDHRPERVRVLEENIWSKAPQKGEAALSYSWLLQRRMGVNHWSLEEPVTLGDNEWFLMADRRDHAIDSRWWGPISEDDIEGVVRLRAGSSDVWRNSIQILSPP